MKSANLSKELFESEGKQIIEKIGPGVLQNISVGLINGEHIFDDPSQIAKFQVFMFEQDENLQNKISDALETRLPKTYKGRNVPFSDENGVYVWFWPDFTEYILGLRRRPIDPISYAKVSEAQFYALLSGTIFWDPNYELQRAQLQWDHMPQEVWYWRHHWIFRNLENRKLVRLAIEDDDKLTAKMMISRYIEWTIRLSFLAARKYSPRRSLLLEAHSQLQKTEEIHQLITSAIESHSAEGALEKIEKAIMAIRLKMIEKKYLPENIGLDENGNTDCLAMSEYFLSAMPGDFRKQASRVCPVDLLGSLEQRAKNTP